MLQRHAVQKFHDDERLIPVFADLMNGANVWMVQSGSGACFTAEAFERLRILSYVLRQKLQCDKSAKLSVLGLVHHTHPAAAEFLDDAIVRDGLADHWRESYVCGTGKSMKARVNGRRRKKCPKTICGAAWVTNSGSGDGIVNGVYIELQGETKTPFQVKECNGLLTAVEESCVLSIAK